MEAKREANTKVRQEGTEEGIAMQGSSAYTRKPLAPGLNFFHLNRQAAEKKQL